MLSKRNVKQNAFVILILNWWVLASAWSLYTSISVCVIHAAIYYSAIINICPFHLNNPEPIPH